MCTRLEFNVDRQHVTAGDAGWRMQHRDVTYPSFRVQRLLYQQWAEMAPFDQGSTLSALGKTQP